MADGPAHEVWAVEGNVFTLPRAAGDRVYEALGDGGETGADEVCRALAADGDGNAATVLALLDKLYRLRGIDLVDEERTP